MQGTIVYVTLERRPTVSDFENPYSNAYFRWACTRENGEGWTQWATLCLSAVSNGMSLIGKPYKKGRHFLFICFWWGFSIPQQYSVSVWKVISVGFESSWDLWSLQHSGLLQQSMNRTFDDAGFYRNKRIPQYKRREISSIDTVKWLSSSVLLQGRISL